MKRLTDMPFGAKLLDSGEVLFRLWAPTADSVELSLEENGTGKLLPMERHPDGWFLCETGKAGGGSRYRYRINGDLFVPDPASRFQPDDIHGSSEVIDPAAYSWQNDAWRGRPWREAVVYELHVGSFTGEGSFRAVAEKLDYLADLGITCIELMPVSDFPGRRNWGYDGVYQYAPDSSYGRPEDLKKLIDAAHDRNLMVMLDVVYNHFGPEGNYLHAYAAPFFTERFKTPWGAAINFSGPESHWVRQFFIHNALYWLEEYNFDGLRLDAVHAVYDNSERHILEELAETVGQYFPAGRHIHLVLENDSNEARFLERAAGGRPCYYRAQWNDDVHHALHVLLTGEQKGYYGDYADAPAAHLGRCLAEGFAYQGEPSPYRNNKRRGTPSAHLPPESFVAFLQNHDQIGNRALGERICSLAPPEAVRAATAVTLLAPSIPLLFMGEEWGCCRPFPFFCDFEPGLSEKVAEGRRREFSRFPEFASKEARHRIPDPCAPETFAEAVLDWREALASPGREWLALFRELLALRRRKIVPLSAGIIPDATRWKLHADRILQVKWLTADSTMLLLLANLGETEQPAPDLPDMVSLYATHTLPAASPKTTLPPWSVFWYLHAPAGTGL